MMEKQKRERLVNLINRFVSVLKEQSGMVVTREFLKGTLERRVSEHTEFLVKDFLRNITALEAREMMELVDECVSEGKEVREKVEVKGERRRRIPRSNEGP